MAVTAEERIKAWVQDPTDHVVIWAHSWTSQSRGVKRSCEGCGREISVWPVIARKAGENARFHILCRESCLPLTLKINGPMPYHGTISDNKLPEKLEKF